MLAYKNYYPQPTPKLHEFWRSSFQIPLDGHLKGGFTKKKIHKSPGFGGARPVRAC